MTPKVMEFVPAMGLLAICGLCGCDEEPVVLVDYTPRCVGFSFQYFEVSRNGPGWTLEGPVRPKDLPEYLDVEIGECSWGGLASVDVQDIELRSIPSPDAPTEEPTPLDFVLEPDVDLPVSLREPGKNAPKDSVPSLTIRIPTEALTGIASHRAVLDVTTNAAEAEATSHPGQGVCNEDPATGRINGWCGVSERPTPDDGKFVTRIEFWIVP